jgi:hypothetical protein
MKPDFNKKTVDTIAKRARYICSNPDCLVSTSGPHSEPDKSTIIGEAAHICGARPESKRYNPNMTDTARAEITNAIWLCCNCHKLIDTDERRFSSEVLFMWREQHEKYVQSELGNVTDRFEYRQQSAELEPFENYPFPIKRIVIDKPDGWEWRLTAELMRYFNRPLFRKMQDLRDGLYVKNQKYISNKEVLDWAAERLAECSKLIMPLPKLLNKLNQSWGAPGEAGNTDKILRTTLLIKENLEQIILFEEQIYFVNVSEPCEGLINLLKDILASQVEKLAEIPSTLDEVVSLINEEHEGTTEEPLIITKTIDIKCHSNISGWNVIK